jgi:hypothetical protein
VWTLTGRLKTSRDSHTATLLLPNGQVLAAAGETEVCTVQGCGPLGLASAELYDPGTGTWQPTGKLSTMRIGHRAALLPTGQVLVMGGLSSAANPSSALATAELYDPATETWQPTGSMSDSRTRHTATLLASGQVLVTGGLGDCTPFCRTLASAEIYTP